MMTEELPPLPGKTQLTQNPSRPPADDMACLLEAIESNSSTNQPRNHNRKYGNYHSLDIESRDTVQLESPGVLYPSFGNPHNSSKLTETPCESVRNGYGANSVLEQKSKYRGTSFPEGEAPVLYDYESTSRFPNNHQNIPNLPTHPSRTPFNVDVISDLDLEHDADYANDAPGSQSQSASNGDVVFISEDAKAERRRTPNLKSQSVEKQSENGREEKIAADKRTSLVRANSEPNPPGFRAYTSKGNGDFVKVDQLDAQFVQSPVASAILLGENVMLLDSVKQGEDPRLVCPTSGCTFFHLVAQASTSDRELSWVPMVFSLSNAGADPNVKDKEGVTPIGIAISRKVVQIVAALLKCGAEVNGDDMFQAEQIRGVVKSEMMETIRRLHPSYWSAVHDLTPFKVNRLVKAWARVNVCRYGKTLIEYAKEHARDQTIVKLLLQNEASIELAHAVMAGDRDRVKVLLCDSAVDLNTSDTSVKNNFFEPFAPLTLYGAAMKLGHIGVLNELKAAQARHRSSVVYSSVTSYSGSTRDSGYSSSGIRMKDTAVVFYKGSSNEEICEIRNTSKPVSSALCAIV